MRGSFVIALAAVCQLTRQVRAGGSSLSSKPLLHRLRGGSGEPVSATNAVVEFDPAHAVDAHEYLARVRVAPDIGLASARVEELRKIYGPNVLAAEVATPWWKLVIAQFDDRLVQILLGVAVLSYGLAILEGEANGWVEPVAILSILVLNAMVGTWQVCVPTRAYTAYTLYRESFATDPPNVIFCTRLPCLAGTVCPVSSRCIAEAPTGDCTLPARRHVGTQYACGRWIRTQTH